MSARATARAAGRRRGTGGDSRPLVVVGDALLDRDLEGTVERLAPDAPVPVVDEAAVRTRPGGAGLAALLAAAGGREVTLVTALGADPAGEELRAALAAAGVEVLDLGLAGPTPEKVRVRAAGRSLLRIDRGSPASVVGAATAAARAAIGWAPAVLVADYGRGVAAEPGVRESLAAAVASGVPVVWDPHPRGREPVAGVALVTPNAAEAARFAAQADEEALRDALAATATATAGAEPATSLTAEHADPVAVAALALAARWSAAVAVTRGGRGALLARPDGTVGTAPAEAVTGGDPCGAGDRFASRAAELLADGAPVADAVAGAVAAATAFVAAGGAAGVPHGAEVPPELAAGRRPARPAPGDRALPPDVAGVVARTRARGGTVVATGGCFDLLHPGHVGTLEAARAEGDCLVVLLNSDASVRRLKGEGRPVVGEEDRAAVLRALRCVDAVLIFEEDDPSVALARLRPDVWAKGGDYAVEDLPEAEALRGWGCRIALLPYLAGRSTTKLIEEAAIRAV